ncbi:Ycf66 family protein [Argonema antarcticum]|uniref:Ycf66 family protein n=1 Tax=Argonema antarcticum TaxID=2942763 RepID=UPI00201161AE|nr:Ycf66 family protein [Argonema antarcticum]MCL1470917.1 Ycf66 family protein [Argonema antarcticum A004/B2]
MINVNFNLASMSGIVLAIGGTALYALRTWRPELSRDSDIFFSAVSLLCGGILLVYGWRFDPIMQFGQVLLTGATIFFAIENLRLRGVATEQAKRNTPIVDEERPVSRKYKVYQDAELDALTPDDEELIPRRLRGNQESRNTRNGTNGSETRRRPTNRDTSNDKLGSGETRRQRRPRPETPRPEVRDEWGDSGNVEDTQPRRSGNRPPRDEPRQPETASPRPRRRPAGDSGYDRERSSRNTDPTPSDYVDYQPIDPNDDEEDNSVNFDR